MKRLAISTRISGERLRNGVCTGGRKLVEACSSAAVVGWLDGLPQAEHNPDAAELPAGGIV